MNKMKTRTFLIIAILLLLVNFATGWLLSAYEPFNVYFTSIVIVLTAVLVGLLHLVRLKDAFAISLSFLFSFLGMVQFVLGCVSPARVEDNGFVIASVIILAFEAIVLLICNLISKKIE